MKALETTASDPSSIEVLVKVDHSDKETQELIRSINTPFSFRHIIMDGLYGRISVPEYTNTLAWNSTGEIIWWLSDEVRVKTHGWDRIIWDRVSPVLSKPAVFHPIGGAFYPLITRRLMNLVGRFTFSIALDSYLAICTGPLRHYKAIPVDNTLPIEWEHASAANQYGDDRSTRIDKKMKDLFLEDMVNRSKWDAFNMDLNEPKVKTIFREVAQELLDHFGIKHKPWW